MGEAPATVSGGVVAGDLACVRCRYNLRTMKVEGVCPECGHGVSASVMAARAGQVNNRRVMWAAAMLAAGPVILVGYYLLLYQFWWKAGGRPMALQLMYAIFTTCHESLMVGAAMLLARACRRKTGAISYMAIFAVAVAGLAAACHAGDDWMRWIDGPMIRATHTSGMPLVDKVSGILMTSWRVFHALALIACAVLLAQLTRPGRRWRVAVAAAVCLFPSVLAATLEVGDYVARKFGIYNWGTSWGSTYYTNRLIVVTIRGSGGTMKFEFWDSVPLALFWGAVAVVAWREHRRQRRAVLSL